MRRANHVNINIQPSTPLTHKHTQLTLTLRPSINKTTDEQPTTKDGYRRVEITKDECIRVADEYLENVE